MRELKIVSKKQNINIAKLKRGICYILLDSVDNLTDNFPTWIGFSKNQIVNSL